MIRVVVYNVSGALDAGAVGSVLADLRPDLACLVEAPSRAGLRRVSRTAALSPVVRAGRRRVSVAILAGERVRVLSQSRHELTSPPGAPARHAAHAIVGVGGLRLSVVAAQLGMRPEVREENRRQLEELLAGVDAPNVLGVDLNESPKGAVAARLGRHLQDAFAVAGEGRGETYPTPDPSTRQDFCYLDTSLTVRRAHVPSHPPIDVASHHRPLVVELAATGAEDEPATSASCSAPPSDTPAEPAA